MYDFEKKCPPLAERLHVWLGSEPGFNDNEEALIYVLAQVIEDKLEAMDTTDESKGAIVSTITRAFGEVFALESEAYRDLMLLMALKKHSTAH